MHARIDFVDERLIQHVDPVSVVGRKLFQREVLGGQGRCGQRAGAYRERQQSNAYERSFHLVPHASSSRGTRNPFDRMRRQSTNSRRRCCESGTLPVDSKVGCSVSLNDRSSLMARGTFAHRTVLASLQCKVAVTIVAEHVKCGFARLTQIGARASVTVETAAETRMVDEVVMAGDAIDGSMIFVREIHMQRERYRCRLQQTRTTRRRRQRQQNKGRDTAGNHGG